VITRPLKLLLSCLIEKVSTNCSHVLTCAILWRNRQFASARRQRLTPPGLCPDSVLGPKKIVKADPRPRPINRNVTAELKSYSLFIIWLQSVRFQEASQNPRNR
jgi:hypothetical protein